MSYSKIQTPTVLEQTRLSTVASTDAASRVVQLIWTTGAVGRQPPNPNLGIAEAYDELLLVTEAAVDLSRLKAGAPILDSHQRATLATQHAVVEDAWLRDGKGYARGRFPNAGISEEADRLFGLVREGIVRNISVGYQINSYRLVLPTKPNERLCMVVERWTPLELSFVTIPVDVGAQVLSGAGARQRMPPPPASAAERQLAVDAAWNAQRSRIRSAGIDPDSPAGLEIQREEAVERMKAAAEKRGVRPVIR